MEHCMWMRSRLYADDVARGVRFRAERRRGPGEWRNLAPELGGVPRSSAGLAVHTAYIGEGTETIESRDWRRERAFYAAGRWCQPAEVTSSRWQRKCVAGEMRVLAVFLRGWLCRIGDTCQLMSSSRAASAQVVGSLGAANPTISYMMHATTVNQNDQCDSNVVLAVPIVRNKRNSNSTVQ
eukprot:2780549-Pyramimonas_sp.AAC.1